MASSTVTAILDGARLADIRRNAQPGSDTAYLLDRIDELTDLLQRARAECAQALADTASLEAGLGLNEAA